MGAMSNLHADLTAAGVNVTALLDHLPRCDVCREELGVISVSPNGCKILVCCDNPGCGETSVSMSRAWWMDVPLEARCDGS